MLCRANHAAERDRTAQRTRPRANGATVVAAVHDPFAFRRLAGDDADVMRPHHDDADTRPPGIAAFARPVAREREIAVVLAEIGAQIRAAPGARITTIGERTLIAGSLIGGSLIGGRLINAWLIQMSMIAARETPRRRYVAARQLRRDARLLHRVSLIRHPIACGRLPIGLPLINLTLIAEALISLPLIDVMPIGVTREIMMMAIPVGTRLDRK